MKVLVVDDSILMRNIIKEVLREAGIEIVGEAGDGRAALQLTETIRPDLLVMDFNMPVMNGLEATGAIMSAVPTPIVIFSNEVDAQLSFQALQAGAVEVMRKPDLDQFNDRQFVANFLAVLRAAVNRPLRRTTTTTRSITGASGPTTLGNLYDAVVIGASTGGPVAVRELLSALPADFPVGIALVQHIEDRFDAGYASWLDGACKLRVRLAQAADRFTPGEVIVAPGGKHLVCHERRLRLDDGPRVCNQKPAVDRLFETSATCFARRVIGVLLTGMGADGADGCVRIKGAGGLTLVQDEATSFIYGMPKAAFERGGASRVLPLNAIAGALLEAVGHHG